MADEVLKRDQNHVTVLAGVTDDADQEIRMLRVDPITKRLLIDVVGSAGLLTASNGLNAVLSDVRLGGALIENTTITSTLYDLTITRTIIDDAQELAFGASALIANTGGTIDSSDGGTLILASITDNFNHTATTPFYDGLYFGIAGINRNTGSGTVTAGTGVAGVVDTTGGGTITHGTGVLAQTGLSSGGFITNGYGVYAIIGDPYGAGATINTGYGFYVKDIVATQKVPFFADVDDSQNLFRSTTTDDAIGGTHRFERIQNALLNSAQTMGAVTNQFQVDDNNNYTGVLIASYNAFELNGTGTITEAVGSFGLAQNSSATGTITTAYGLGGNVTNELGGTITTAVGVYANVENLAGGTITTAYGFRVRALAGTTKIGVSSLISGSYNEFLETRLKDKAQLRFYDSDSTQYASFEAPTNLAANNTYVLPTGYPAISGYVLSSTDAGVMSWVAGASITLANIGSAPNADGMTLTGSVLNLEPASASFGGVVTATTNTTTQQFAGKKDWTYADTGTAAFNGQMHTTTTAASGANAGEINGTLVTLGISGASAYTGQTASLRTSAVYSGSSSAFVVAGIIPTAFATGGTTTLLVGNSGGAYVQSTATANNAVGTYTEVQALNTATVTSAIGVAVTMTKAVGATVTTGYGIRIDALMGTTQYAFHGDIAGSINMFRETRIRAATAIKFYDTDNSHYTGIAANGTTTASVDYTLPAAGPAVNGYVLSSTTAGVMSWISASGITLDVIGSTPNANGATLTGTVLNLEPASTSFGGVVTTLTQSFTGQKTITNTFVDLTGPVSLRAVATVTNTGNDVEDALAFIGRIEVTDNFNHAGLVLGSLHSAEQLGNGNIDTLVGSLGAVTHSGNGTVTLAAGNNGTIDNGGAGVITQAIAVYGEVTNSGGGSITKAVGVHIEDLQGTTLNLGFEADIYHSSNILREIDIPAESDNNRSTLHKVLWVDTTDATPTEATDDGAAGSGSTNRISIPVDGVRGFIINVVAKKQGTADAKQMIRQVALVNNGGTTALVSGISTIGTDIFSAALTTAAVTFTANNTDDCLTVTVTGVAATNLRWTVEIFSSEAIYA